MMGVIASATWTSGVSSIKISASKELPTLQPIRFLSVALRGTPPMRAWWRTTSAIAAGSYPALSEDCECTATGLLQASTQWTNRLARSTENRISKRNFRTHKDGLERTQANS
jgi:hypothetical protein